MFFQLKAGRVITETPELICSQNLVKKTKLTQRQDKALWNGCNETTKQEYLVASCQSTQVYVEDLIVSFLSLLKVKHRRRVNNPSVP